MVARLTLICLSYACVSAAAQARIDTLYCEPRDTLRNLLVSEYGAQMTGHGVRGPDVMLEIWSAPDSGAWTLVQTYANGQACIVAMGDHWESTQTTAEPS
ncbi:MAG: hypothetical protein AAGF50_07100 [Pseudomonadota bacterium]